MPSVFQLSERPGPIAVLTFDTPDKKVNTLGRAVLEELGQVVAQLAKRTDLHGLVLRSGKPGQFIAGADLNELGALVSLTTEQKRKALTE
jgi:enoyl-CoA hydratase/carnithine racemase